MKATSVISTVRQQLKQKAISEHDAMLQKKALGLKVKANNIFQKYSFIDNKFVTH